MRISAINLNHWGLFKDPSARALRSPSQTQRQVERVAMPSAHVQSCPKAACCTQHLRQLIPVHKADLIVIILLIELADVIPAVPVKAGSVIGVEQTRLVTDGNIVLGREFLHQNRCLDPDAIGLARIIDTDQVFELILLDPLTHTRLTTVATRGAPARAVRIDNHDGMAAFSTVQRRAQPCKARADNADISLDRLAQCRAVDHPDRCCRVVGRRIQTHRPVVLVQ